MDNIIVTLSATIAQLVEHRIRNARVAGSNPVGGSSSNYAGFRYFSGARFLAHFGRLVPY